MATSLMDRPVTPAMMMGAKSAEKVERRSRGAGEGEGGGGDVGVQGAGGRSR